jgi:hypothetical protein
LDVPTSEFLLGGVCQTTAVLSSIEGAVVEVAEAAGGRSTCLSSPDGGVEPPVGWLAGVEVGEQLGASPIDGAGQTGDLGDVDLGDPLEEPLELEPGMSDVGSVDGAQQLLGHSAAAHLVVGVTGVQRCLGSRGRVLVEPVAGPQQLADPVERGCLRPRWLSFCCWTRRRTSSMA